MHLDRIRRIVRTAVPDPLRRRIRTCRRGRLQRAYSRGDWAAVAEAWQRAVERNRDTVAVSGYVQLAVSRRMMGEHELAADALASGLEIHRGHPSLLRELDTTAEEGHWSTVSEVWRRAVDHDSTAVPAGGYLQLAASRKMAGNYSLAADALVLGLRLYPGNAKLAGESVDLLTEHPEPGVAEPFDRWIDEAISAFDEAATLSPRNHETMWRYMATVARLRRDELADTMLQRLLSVSDVASSGLDPVKAYRLCIMTLRRNERYEAAWEMVCEALARHSDEPVLLVEAARVAAKRKSHWRRLGQIEQLSEATIRELQPEHGAVLLRALMNHDQIAEAENLHRKLRSVHGDHPVLITAWSNILARATLDHYNFSRVEPSPALARSFEPFLDAQALSRAVVDALSVLDCAREAPHFQRFRRRAAKGICSLLYGMPGLSASDCELLEGTLMQVVFGPSVRSGHPFIDAARAMLTVTADNVAPDAGWLQQELETLGSGTPFDALDIELLYRPLAWQGCLSLAHQVRRVASERLIMEADDEVSALKIAATVLAACECLDPMEAEKWAERLREDCCLGPMRRDAVAAYQQLIAGNRAYLQWLWQKSLTPDEIRFSEYVRGRTIAIVAPAPGDADNGAEIDGFDIVVRPNAYQGVQPASFSRHGSRTDACSFNASRLRRLRSEIPSETASVQVAPGIKVLLQKSQYTAFHGQDLEFEVIRSRIKDLDQYTQGHGTHLPHLLFYLLGFSPSRIKLFNANFFLSSTAHESTYRDVVPGNPGLFAYNDMIDVGHWFARTAWRHGLVDVDDEAAAVLSLDTADYMAGIERLCRQGRPSADDTKGEG